jgi:DNA-binding MarR family transcriptional regulator
MTDTQKANELAKGIVATSVKNHITHVENIAKALGVSEPDVQKVIKQLAYRKTYNQKPEVKARRAAYNHSRQSAMKALRLAIRSNPDLQKAVTEATNHLVKVA